MLQTAADSSHQFIQESPPTKALVGGDCFVILRPRPPSMSEATGHAQLESPSVLRRRPRPTVLLCGPGRAAANEYSRWVGDGGKAKMEARKLEGFC